MSIPSSMNAVEITTPGAPDVLKLCTTEVPVAGPYEVLIRVHAAGVNRPDCMQRRGLYKVPADASIYPGLEVAGEIVSCGAEVSRWRPGDRVVALTHGGGYAEFCKSNEGHCLPWPESLSSIEAAALPETCFTVQHNLLTRASLSANDTVLIHGGSSGIGTTAIQVAKAIGAQVITTAGSDKKCQYCIELGADHAINYRTRDWFEQAEKITAGHGVDVVLDMVAGPYVEKNLNLLALDGRYAMIAFLLGPQAEVNFMPVLSKRLTLTGSMLRPQTAAQKSAIAADCKSTMWPLIDSGQLRSVVHASFPLADAASAHELMESSEHLGKIVLTTEHS
jgi:NADPH2:quinone reductase